MYTVEDINKAKKYLSDKGYGTGSNFTLNAVANLMAEWAAKNCSIPPVSNSAFKCVEPELQPVECEKWRGCFDCPYYRQS